MQPDSQDEAIITALEKQFDKKFKGLKKGQNDRKNALNQKNVP